MILKGLTVGGIILIAASGRPSLSQIIKILKEESPAGRHKIKKSVNGLLRKKLVTVSYKNGREIIQITENGKVRVLEYDIDELSIKKPAKWDGYWRIVTFDIPNTKKKVRDAINFKLKDMGFVPLQKSIFTAPYESRQEIDFLGEHFMVRKNIKYIVAKTVDGEKELKNKFNLT